MLRFKINYDPFVLRQFKPDFIGTNLSKIDKYTLLDIINFNANHIEDTDYEFCKYVVFENPYDDITTNVVPIDLLDDKMRSHIRSGYAKRVEGELPVLSRWLNYGNIALPKANYIVCILYSREQLFKEHQSKNDENIVPFYFDSDIDFGIVAIQATVLPRPDPMVPCTMMRNALGIEEGGNGVKLNHDKYMESVKFWDNHIIVK